MPGLLELENEYDAKKKSVYQLVKDKPDYNWSQDEIDRFQQGQKELNDLVDRLTPLRNAKAAADAIEREEKELNRPMRHVVSPGSPEPEGERNERKAERILSPGEAFIQSAEYKEWQPDVHRAGRRAGTDVKGFDFKTTFTTTASTLTQYDRQPGMVMIGQQRLTIADLLAQGETTQNTIRYVKEDTFTNAATVVAEGATKPEAAFDTSEVDAPVRKIAVVAKVTDEMFADFPMIRDYINNRLRFMVAQTEEAELYAGSGSGAHLTGITQTAGIQTQAKGSDPTPDAFYKAITKIRSVGFFEPDAVVVHPNDWTDIRLLRTSTDVYMWGPPTDGGVERLWGLPVVVTTAATEGTGLVGAFRMGAQIFRREGLRVEATNSNEDDFKKNLIALRAEERLALAVYRPLAFCTVTGI